RSKYKLLPPNCLDRGSAKCFTNLAGHEQSVTRIDARRGIVRPPHSSQVVRGRDLARRHGAISNHLEADLGHCGGQRQECFNSLLARASDHANRPHGARPIGIGDLHVDWRIDNPATSLEAVLTAAVEEELRIRNEVRRILPARASIHEMPGHALRRGNCRRLHIPERTDQHSDRCATALRQLDPNTHRTDAGENYIGEEAIECGGEISPRTSRTYDLFQGASWMSEAAIEYAHCTCCSPLAGSGIERVHRDVMPAIRQLTEQLSIGDLSTTHRGTIPNRAEGREYSENSHSTTCDRCFVGVGTASCVLFSKTKKR